MEQSAINLTLGSVTGSRFGENTSFLSLEAPSDTYDSVLFKKIAFTFQGLIFDMLCDEHTNTNTSKDKSCTMMFLIKSTHPNANKDILLSMLQDAEKHAKVTYVIV